MNKLIFALCVFMYGFEIQEISNFDYLCFPIGPECLALVKLFPISSSHPAVIFQRKKLTFSDNNPISAAVADRAV